MGESSGKTLAELQKWFGSSISQRLPEEYPGNPLAVSRPELQAVADAHLKGKGGLSGFSRLGIYNQQYWFRLISIMQSEYTCTVHLMGLSTFNLWVIRFLEMHPPSSPYLAQLDAAFPAFLEANYTEANRLAALQSVAHDRAYSRAFDAPAGTELKALGLTDLSPLMSRKLQLAPHLTPLHLDYDFASYREICQLDESLLGVYDLHLLEDSQVIYRNQHLQVQAQTVSKTALTVLEEFKTPTLLTEAFERLGNQLSSVELIELEENLGPWFQEWVERSWFCVPL